MKKLIYIVLFLVASFGYAQNEQLFKEATDLYNSGKYEDAIAKYQAILKSGEHSAALYYNLGNANYKLSNIGPSIYYYEKALQLAPNDADIKNNIAFAQQMRVDAITPLPKTGWQKFKERTLGYFTFDGWAVVAVVLVVLFVVFIISYFLVITSWVKRLFFILGFVMLFAAGFSVYFAQTLYTEQNNNKFAIVYVPETPINAEPNTESNTVFTLHEGTKVKVVASLNDWKKIQLADGKVGWVIGEAIKKL